MDPLKTDFINCHSKSRYRDMKPCLNYWGGGVASFSTIPSELIKPRTIPLCSIYRKSYLPQPWQSTHLSIHPLPPVEL